MKSGLRQARAAGFTLIELMIAVVILTLLVAIAVPSYRREIEESRRTDAKTALLDLASREQRFFSLQNSFTTDFANLGYAAAGTNPASVNVGSGYYSVTVAVPSPNAPANPNSFLLTATPVAGTTQASDTSCQQFTVDYTGLQLSQDGSGNPTSSTCW
ncbi:MAG: type IV pilin protein [Steroidobacteraceae bacterium]